MNKNKTERSKDKYAIQIKDLTKKYGDFTAVKDLTLNVQKGEIFGFLGPNGAGKSTTIRVLMAQIQFQKGGYSVLGVPHQQITPQVFKQIGYLSGEAYLFEDYSALKLFKYLSALNGNGTENYHELSERFDLDLKKKIKDLSSGNRQKVALIQALMTKPQLLILDEPTTGLDPLIQREFEKVIREYVQNGTTVFLSSHIMSEVEKICDRVGIIRKGELIKVSTIRELHAEMELYEVKLFMKNQQYMKDLQKLEKVTNFTEGVRGCNFIFNGNANELLKSLSRFEIEDLSISEPSLEDMFLRYYDQKDE